MRQYTLRHVNSVGDTSLITIGHEGQLGFRFSDFQLGRELGRGEGGAVSIAKHTPTNRLFALKEISIAGQAERHQLAMELKTHWECGEMANIVQLFDTFYEEGRVYLVLEYMDWGSLEFLLQLQVCLLLHFHPSKGVPGFSETPAPIRTPLLLNPISLADFVDQAPGFAVEMRYGDFSRHRRAVVFCWVLGDSASK